MVNSILKCLIPSCLQFSLTLNSSPGRFHLSPSTTAITSSVFPSIGSMANSGDSLEGKNSIKNKDKNTTETKSFNRSFTISSSSSNSIRDNKDASFKKPYLYQPIDRSTSVRKFYNPVEKKSDTAASDNSIKSKVKELCKLFGSSKISSRLDLSDSATDLSCIRLPGTEDKIVVYFTSLRGVRRTYEDCYAVRLIFKGLRVLVDERDVSMDWGYRRELQRVMRDKTVSLPQVFVKGRYIGGAEVVKEMFETGKLAKMVEGMLVKAAGYVCQGCGDVRFVPCLNCDGSKKVFDEEEDVVRRCRVCNENGLIRCPSCCL